MIMTMTAPSMKLKLSSKLDVCRVPSMMNVSTKYGERKCYGNRETDLIKKYWT
jgi:hypothetical protein